VVLLLVCLCAGFAGGAYWYHRKAQTSGTRSISEASPAQLSASSLTVLNQLAEPVEIRFYSLLNPATSSEALRTFAARVDELLTAYEENAGGKLKVRRYDISSDTSADDAAFDGMRPFNLEQAPSCYLGLVVASAARKESMPKLSPEWEAGLEPDLSRMIQRVGSPTTAPVAVTPFKPAPATAQELDRLIPDVGSVSLDKGKELLRATALQNLTQITQDMSAKIRSAQERLRASQEGQSKAQQQAAREELQRLQQSQSEQLQEIAKHLQDQIALLEYRKSESTSPEQSQ
jgi:ABC-type uncharacterized transport system involved in gliding motility auxiliary subunit